MDDLGDLAVGPSLAVQRWKVLNPKNFLMQKSNAEVYHSEKTLENGESSLS